MGFFRLSSTFVAAQRGDVFDVDFIETYIRNKRENGILEMKTRPHPLEFEMYFDG